MVASARRVNAEGCTLCVVGENASRGDVASGRGEWCLERKPRRWQAEALESWSDAYRGIVAVVTGAGKTIFAMQCMLRVRTSHPESRFLVVVPTVALQDQWRAALTEELGVREDEISVAGGGARLDKPRRVVIAVANTARRLVRRLLVQGDWLLIVDECHRVASPANRQILHGDVLATLGLSATPERQYDTWFDDFVVPALGPVIYRYSYEQARQEGVISAFDLWNIRVPLSSEEKEQIDSVSLAISREVGRLRAAGLEGSDRLQRLFFARSRYSQSARARVSATVALVDNWYRRRGIVFHESIEGAERIADILARRGHRVRLYHSGLGAPTRYANLKLYTVGQIDVLVTCRALDEGIDVPSTEFGIVAASTSSHRQRIQRLGRILRPSPGKDRATVATLYALPNEASLLQREATSLDDVARVRWYGASHA